LLPTVGREREREREEREREERGWRRTAAMAESNPLRGFPRLRRAAVRCSGRRATGGRRAGGTLQQEER